VRVGIVGDLHLPFEHPNYFEFCRDTFRSWKVEKVVFIGDVLDQHALSFWDHDPDGMSASDEFMASKEHLQPWRRKWKEASVCIGNHDARHFRVAHKAGIPTKYLRNYSDVFETPGWDWKFQFSIDKVLYEHGATSGKYAAVNNAVAKRVSTVMGHTHTYGGVLYHANENSRIFALQVGCGIDIEAYAFAYGKHFAVRPTLGCGIVVDGSLAVFEPMPISKGESYRRKRKC
jgi:predicted phosphodiesterase